MYVINYSTLLSLLIYLLINASNRSTHKHKHHPSVLFIQTFKNIMSQFEIIGIHQQSRMSVYLSVFSVLL
jgi:hypothetical protein